MLTSTGLGSGLDIDSIVTAIVDAERVPLMARVDARQSRGGDWIRLSVVSVFYKQQLSQALRTRSPRQPTFHRCQMRRNSTQRRRLQPTHHQYQFQPRPQHSLTHWFYALNVTTFLSAAAQTPSFGDMDSF